MAQVTGDTLLVVGRTGNGKSSTINSILQKQVTTRGDEISVNTNGDLTLIDGSGIGDTGDDMIVTPRDLIDSIKEKMAQGFTALLFMLKYGVRFTQQEKNAVKTVKSIFGEDVFRNWGIIVMTHGDNFELDQDEDYCQSFQDWCQDQRGDIQNLFQECSGRCVLFNNKRPDDTQNQVLNSFVQKVKSTVKRPYSMLDFNHAKNMRDLWMQQNDKQYTVTIPDEDLISRPTANIHHYKSLMNARNMVQVLILAVPAILLYLWTFIAALIYIVLYLLVAYWKYNDQINALICSKKKLYISSAV
ncbi:GTPase IMAP family member 7-like [Physella acuta]|uniref:GTPase IMAP family member 7-like n=1 Tax=Physella acuta TaxID=109671 RepID=UPI0027DC88E1|nr:GTPase IMAP family member 7-like [Physella acuta]